MKITRLLVPFFSCQFKTISEGTKIPLKNLFDISFFLLTKGDCSGARNKDTAKQMSTLYELVARKRYVLPQLNATFSSPRIPHNKSLI